MLTRAKTLMKSFGICCKALLENVDSRPRWRCYCLQGEKCSSEALTLHELAHTFCLSTLANVGGKGSFKVWTAILKPGKVCTNAGPEKLWQECKTTFLDCTTSKEETGIQKTNLVSPWCEGKSSNHRCHWLEDCGRAWQSDKDGKQMHRASFASLIGCRTLGWSPASS